MKEITLSVEGMSCISCIQKIEHALLSIPGVERALADLARESVTIEFDDNQVTVKRLKDTIQEAGYTIQ